jgi:hypothetical protein
MDQNPPAVIDDSLWNTRKFGANSLVGAPVCAAALRAGATWVQELMVAPKFKLWRTISNSNVSMPLKKS